MPVTLASLSEQTGLAVLDHLEKSVSIPVVSGVQAQGDVIVIPIHLVQPDIRLQRWAGQDAGWSPVPTEGVELVSGAGGANPHTLVADPWTCRWTRDVRDATGLAVAVFENTEVAYLLHPEHGASGCAPGTYIVRRQRELQGPRGPRMVCD